MYGPWSSRCCAELELHGWSVTLHDRNGSVVVAVDAGGTKVLGALVRPGGSLVREHALPRRKGPGSEVTLPASRPTGGPV